MVYPHGENIHSDPHYLPVGGSSVVKKLDVPVCLILQKIKKKTSNREKVKNAKIIQANYFKGINILIYNTSIHQRT